MFFRKLGFDRGGAASATNTAIGSSDASSDAPKLVAIDGGASRKGGAPSAHGLVLRTSEGQVDEVGLVLDTLGSILTAFSRHSFDLPDRSSEQITSDLQRWQRHATLGVPVDQGEGSAVGVRERDWDGIARTFTEHRRDESRYVDSTVNELRDALWSVVETVHNAAKVEQHADREADTQVVRARSALTRMQSGQIKSEVLGALTAIEDSFRVRQAQMQAQYQALHGRIESLDEQLEVAKKESTTDPLTGLGNRKLFDGMAKRAIHMHALSGQPVALLMVDLDKFKLVNDMYGHQAGDQTLVGVAKCLSKVFLRQSDVVCRFGGDEFSVVLNNTDLKVSQMLARRLVQSIADMPTPHNAMEFAIGASMGLAMYDGQEPLDSWIARADRALYEAKKMSGDRIATAGPTLSQT